jgi:hypothetical protein
MYVRCDHHNSNVRMYVWKLLSILRLLHPAVTGHRRDVLVTSPTLLLCLLPEQTFLGAVYIFYLNQTPWL